MKYNFTQIIDRKNTYSIKHNHTRSGVPEDAIPLWVADMDIQTPPCVIEALQKQVSHGIFGYSEPDERYFEVVMDWFRRRFSWRTQKEWIVLSPGVVTAIHIAIEALTNPGDGVLIQEPVYNPFAESVNLTRRTLQINELVYSDGRYTIDFDDFEEKAKHSKLFILCNPHNHVGRVWTLEELSKIGEICLRHGLMVISDEIHQDFVFPNHKHTVFSEINPDLAERTITCTAPSKTFNLAGLLLSNIFITNEKLRKKYKAKYSEYGLSQNGVMGIVACKAAYEQGEKWANELVNHINGNMRLIDKLLSEKIPQISLVNPEGTYIAWLDCKKLGFSDDQLDSFMRNKAKLWLVRGTNFGKSGTGFMRLNTACSDAVIKKALLQLETALK